MARLSLRPSATVPCLVIYFSVAQVVLSGTLL
jgi:hypothetical protein